MIFSEGRGRIGTSQTRLFLETSNRFTQSLRSNTDVFAERLPAVMGLEKPEAAAIVICPAEGVIVMFAPATIDFHSSPEPLLTTPNI